MAKNDNLNAVLQGLNILAQAGVNVHSANVQSRENALERELRKEEAQLSRDFQADEAKKGRDAQLVSEANKQEFQQIEREASQKYDMSKMLTESGIQGILDTRNRIHEVKNRLSEIGLLDGALKSVNELDKTTGATQITDKNYKDTSKTLDALGKVESHYNKYFSDYSAGREVGRVIDANTDGVIDESEFETHRKDIKQRDPDALNKDGSFKDAYLKGLEAYTYSAKDRKELELVDLNKAAITLDNKVKELNRQIVEKQLGNAETEIRLKNENLKLTNTGLSFKNSTAVETYEKDNNLKDENLKAAQQQNALMSIEIEKIKGLIQSDEFKNNVKDQKLVNEVIETAEVANLQLQQELGVKIVDAIGIYNFDENYVYDDELTRTGLNYLLQPEEGTTVKAAFKEHFEDVKREDGYGYDNIEDEFKVLMSSILSSKSDEGIPDYSSFLNKIVEIDENNMQYEARLLNFNFLVKAIRKDGEVYGEKINIDISPEDNDRTVLYKALREYDGLMSPEDKQIILEGYEWRQTGVINSKLLKEAFKVMEQYKDIRGQKNTVLGTQLQQSIDYQGK